MPVAASLLWRILIKLVVTRLLCEPERRLNAGQEKEKHRQCHAQVSGLAGGPGVPVPAGWGWGSRDRFHITPM